jgi:hypothetical protein
MPLCYFSIIESHRRLPFWHILTWIILILCVQPVVAQRGWHLEAWLRPQSTELLNAAEDRLDASINERQQSWGMATGLGGGWALTDRWSIWTGLAYSLQQQDYRSHSLLLNGSEQHMLRELRVEYVQFPLRLEYSLPIGERMQLQSGIGTYLAGMLRVTERDDDRRYREWPPPPAHFSQYPPRSATFKKWHLGLQARTGLAFKIRYNLWAFTHVYVEYALEDVEDKSISFLWTEAGVTERVAYYDSRHRPEFGINRGSSNWLCLGGQIGIRYIVVQQP